MSKEQAIEFDSEVDIVNFVIGNYKNGCVMIQYIVLEYYYIELNW